MPGIHPVTEWVIEGSDISESGEYSGARKVIREVERFVENPWTVSLRRTFSTASQ
jgi:hypothetical protein